MNSSFSMKCVNVLVIDLFRLTDASNFNSILIPVFKTSSRINSWYIDLKENALYS